MAERVEWLVTRLLRTQRVNYQDGAQSVYGLTTARKLVKQLGPPWEIRHCNTGDAPKDH
jgi:hypothetical protein